MVRISQEYEAERSRLEAIASGTGVKALGAQNMLAQLSSSPLAEELNKVCSSTLFIFPFHHFHNLFIYLLISCVVLNRLSLLLRPLFASPQRSLEESMPFLGEVASPWLLISLPVLSGG
jgi:hypothetical protein